MPSITATALRERMERDLPGVAVATRPRVVEAESKPKAKGKHAAERPDFLATNDTVVVADRLRDAAIYLRDACGYTYLSDIAVVDYLDDGLFEIVYRFYHLDDGDALVIKVRVPRDAPNVPSLTPIWPGADFHEREAFDLFGIVFEGHPSLIRIYMWDEFEGYPMRRDFPKQGDKYIDE